MTKTTQPDSYIPKTNLRRHQTLTEKYGSLCLLCQHNGHTALIIVLEM